MTYRVAPPNGAFDARDLAWSIVHTLGIAPPDLVAVDPATGNLVVAYSMTPDPMLDATQVAALATLVASNPQPVNAPWRVQQTLLDRAQTALAVNDAYLALTAPTTGQTLAQVKALTRECSALIRLLVQQLDTTAGT